MEPTRPAPSSTSRRRLRPWVVLLALAVALALAGCGFGGGDGSSSGGARSSSGGDAVADADGADSAAEVADTGTSGAGAEQATVPEGQPISEDRDVIATGTLALTVDDATDAGARAKVVADDAGGYVASSEADVEASSTVRMTLRVPTAAFDAAMADLAELGEVTGREVATDDVTDQVVDLEGRLENARTSTERLRELLAEAQDVSHVIAIEDRLTQREGEIELMSGQLAALGDQVDLATVHLTLDEPEPAAAPEVSDDLPGFVEALRSGAATLGTIGLGLLAVVGFALPFVPLVGGGWLLVRWRGRRRNALGKREERPVA